MALSYLLLSCSFLSRALSANTIIFGEDRNITEWFWQTSVVAGSQLYGGWPYTEDSTYSQSLWSLDMNDATSGDWSSSTSTGMNGLENDSRAPGGSAYTYADSTFYALGGSTPNYQSAVQGFLTYDDTAGIWTNDSSKPATSTGYWSLAAAAAAPGFGSAGYLVFVGGTATETRPGATTSTQLMDLSIITLYDLAAGVWYQQPATGDIPPPRSAFCSVSASTTDTFEIFVYGGSINQATDAGNPDDTGFLNVYALSLPAFRWFKSTDATVSRRANHHCTVIGERQMVSIGGDNPSGQKLGWLPDPWANGIGIFDMTAFNWSSSYDANAAQYESPDVVKQYYSSSFTTPSWSNPTLAEVFGAQTSLSTEATSSASTPSSPSTSNYSPSPSSSSTPILPIAVGVAVGFVLIVGTAVAAICLRRRRRSKQKVEKDDQNWLQGESHRTEWKGSRVSTTSLQPPSEIGTYHPRAELPAESPARSRSKLQELAA
ncbi:hypothetical protein LTR70_002861 [Exophiala xenobiotica]|uniref:Kelch repeat protein n=1 Tax=Lithohypha guttulata TaxID=1690604 RepID=A0ABR0KJA1_9EURO|nr:hypothetical protein LTR24_002075 [Lithohypha guttulata]KAK5324577.1 hypothetical protein LTR70_002861 [Exophiala xenobiotica]